MRAIAALTLFAVFFAQRFGGIGADSGAIVQTGDVAMFQSARTCQGQEMRFEQCEGLPPCDLCAPIDCQFEEWTEWSALADDCTELCVRERRIHHQNNECGNPCEGNKSETKACPNPSCHTPPVDCALGLWSDWSTCLQGPLGQSQRTREIEVSASNGGAGCTGELTETTACGVDGPQNCELTNWGAWSECDLTCGGGRQTRMRRLDSHAMYGGSVCSGPLVLSQSCNTQSCEPTVDCFMSPWSEWAGCNAVSPGQKQRHRAMAESSRGDGKACNEPLQETKECIEAQAPINCVLSDWRDWDDCDVTCGGGQTYRKREVLASPKNGGSCKASSLLETSECASFPCSPLQCILTHWSDWGSCSRTCGIGETMRKRAVRQEAPIDGVPCKGNLEELMPCDMGDCASEDCEWGGWMEWGGCTCSCGGGTRHRVRSVLTLPRAGGKLCDPQSKQELGICNTQPCKLCIDGAWGDWSAWSPCSSGCGAGLQSRHRDVARIPTDCGKIAEGLEDEFKACTGPPCEEDRDCELSTWSEWSTCSCSCHGVRERVRDVLRFASGKGRPCSSSALKVTEGCNPGPGEEPNDGCGSKVHRPCSFGSWSDWSRCSEVCGGQASRTREILVPPELDGKSCGGVTVETQPCDTQNCLNECVDCEMGDWQEWSGCSNCVDQKYRRRIVRRHSNACGRPCAEEASKETAPCAGDCPQQRFCVWSDWANVALCPVSGECGPYASVRQRSLSLTTVVPIGGSALLTANSSVPCQGEQVEQVACPNIPCGTEEPRDCIFGGWSEWSAPTWEMLCERRRPLEVVGTNGGKLCEGPLEETKPCIIITTKKPEDCQYSDWCEWSNCVNVSSQRYRSRGVVKQSANGGRACGGATRETASCTTELMLPVDCELQDWSDWGACSASCDEGVATRSRGIKAPAQYGGEGCKALLGEAQPCQVVPCSQSHDCVMEDWGSWSACNLHTYQKTKTRKVSSGAGSEGAPCEGYFEELSPCDVPLGDGCKLSEWTDWDECDRRCGGGQTTRHRHVTQNPTRQDKMCNEALVETQGCNSEACSFVQDCEFSGWDDWHACSRSCGAGQSQRFRSIAQLAGEGGARCVGSLADTRPCHVAQCNFSDCGWFDWSDWGGCTSECGGGSRMRYRGIRVSPTVGGKACSPNDMSEIGICNTQGCTSTCVDGQWDEWSPFSSCSSSCGGGFAVRTRTPLREPDACGKQLEGLSREVRSCNDDVPCDCTFSDWSVWGGCSQLCDGYHSRSRIIVTHRDVCAGHGRVCAGALQQVAPCNTNAAACELPVTLDCETTDWSAWGQCSASCGVGQHSRSRAISQAPANGGKACPEALMETEGCVQPPCENECTPVDCAWEEWSPWDACTKCAGQKRRYRSVVSVAFCGGKACDDDVAEEVENCPRVCDHSLFCGFLDWEAWSACTSTCGTGASRSRLRFLGLVSSPNESMVEELRFLDDESVVGDFEAVPHEDNSDAASEAKRFQEIAIAFTCGLVTFVVGMLVYRRSRTPTEYSRTLLVDYPGENAEE